MILIRTKVSQTSSQQQDLPAVSEEELSSQRQRSSLVFITSGTQTSSSHDDLIRDTIRKEMGRLTSEMKKDPIQQAMYQWVENFISNEKSNIEGLVSKEEVGLQSSDTDLNREVSCHRRSIRKSSSDRKQLTLDSSTNQTLFGNILIQSKVYEECEVSCYKNLYTFHPADWLIWLGMQTSWDILFSNFTRGWKYNLSARSFRAVSGDALIFELCKEGNVEGIKTLFARGEASVMDREPTGITPLHVSVIFLVISRHQVEFFVFNTNLISGLSRICTDKQTTCSDSH